MALPRKAILGLELSTTVIMPTVKKQICRATAQLLSFRKLWAQFLRVALAENGA